MGIEHKTGIVIFNDGAFGGAVRRYTNLFIHLDQKYPGKFFYLVNNHLFNQITEIYPHINRSAIYIIEDYTKNYTAKKTADETPRFYKDTVPDPDELDRKTLLPRKIYWFYKNRFRQKKLFRRIDKIRKENDIKVFYGVFSGILPLVFYMGKQPPRAAVIFSDMDSWFTDVHRDMKKLWYRKYYSFNYALENSDYVDFLSSYISDGIKKLGVDINDENISVSPCSFTDYSKCTAGEKNLKEIAFCSRLEPDKNPMLYLEAAKEILKKHPDLCFHILGEGSLVNEIRKFIEINGLKDKINFMFHKNPPEIFSKTSVFVSLQKNTNYPSQSLLEAMACGNAVIASNVGDTGMLINESNGILVGLNRSEIITALEKLLSSRELTLSMGEKARRDVTTTHTIGKYTEYFLTLVNKAYSKKFRFVQH